MTQTLDRFTRLLPFVVIFPFGCEKSGVGDSDAPQDTQDSALEDTSLEDTGPVGTGLLYVQGGYATGSLFNADPGSSTSEKLGSFAQYIAAAWAPGGETIAAIRAGGTAENTGLFLLEPDGTDRAQVPNAGAMAGLAWFPDAERIAFRTGTGIDQVNVDGTGLETLVTGYLGNELSLSPDGRELAYLETDFTNYHLMIRDLDTGDAVNVTAAMLGSGDGVHVINTGSPVWTSAGDVVFEVKNSVGLADGYTNGLYVAHADGTGLAPFGAAALPADLRFCLSPDELQLAYVNAGVVSVVTLDGAGAPVQISEDAQGFAPAAPPSWR